MNFQETIVNAPLVLTEGAYVERLRRNPNIKLDPLIQHAGLIYNEEGRSTLERIYRQYLNIGKEHDLPIIACTPTWRANPERLKEVGLLEGRDVNGDAVHFLSEIRDSYGDYAKKIFIGGLLGSKGDAHTLEKNLSASEAAKFHKVQTEALAAPGKLDFLLAASQSSLFESMGIATAFSKSNLPYLLSFIVKEDGKLLDGTPLHKAVAMIDAFIHPRPFRYLINCVHPREFIKALAHESAISGSVRERVIGLQADTFSRNSKSFTKGDQVESERPTAFADSMAKLHNLYGIKVLGGCCGTDARHIEALAQKATETKGLI